MSRPQLRVTHYSAVPKLFSSRSALGQDKRGEWNPHWLGRTRQSLRDGGLELLDEFSRPRVADPAVQRGRQGREESCASECCPLRAESLCVAV
jgi:hypothetical protein